MRLFRRSNIVTGRACEDAPYFEGQIMVRTKKIFLAIILLNITASIGVVICGFGYVSINDLWKVLEWFVSGVFLTIMAMLFMYTASMSVPNEDLDMDDASPRVVRLVMGVIVCGVLSVIVFAKGVIEAVSLLAS
jgi:uncharacterized membrane protein YeiB